MLAAAPSIVLITQHITRSPSNLFCVTAQVLAVRRVGIAVGAAVWTMSATVMGFIGGTFLFEEEHWSPLGAGVGVCFLVVAGCLIGAATYLDGRFGEGAEDDPAAKKARKATKAKRARCCGGVIPVMVGRDHFEGLLFAVAAGLCDGLVVASYVEILHHAGAGQFLEAVEYLASYGVGLLLSTSLFATAYYSWRAHESGVQDYEMPLHLQVGIRWRL